MTCIAGVVKGKKVWIGADSAGVGEEDFSISVRADEKVFKVGEFLFGFCGSFRARDIIRYSLKPPVQPKRQNDHAFLATTFVNAVRLSLIAGGMEHKDNMLDPESAFLLGYRGSLYCVEEDFQVARNAVDFNAVGCGAAVALGALDATPTRPPALRVRLALEAAEHWSAGVRGPFRVLSI